MPFPMSEPIHPAVAERRARWGAVVALCLIQFVDVMSVTVVITALPDMLVGVGGAPADGTLVVTGYAMCFGGLLMFGARLGERVGHRRCIVASLAAFGCGGLLAATATSVLALTAARCLQGAAAAAAVPSALSLLTSVAGRGPARARAIAAWSAAGAAAGAAGFAVGGLVTELGSWRAVFWGLFAMAAALSVVVVALVPTDAGHRGRPPLNLAGSALLTAAVMLGVVGTSLAAVPAHRTTGALLVAGAVLVGASFAVVDRRSTAPLLARAVLWRPQVLRGTAGAFVNTATTSSVAALVTLYLQSTLERTPLATAATFLPFSILVIGGSAAAARLARRHRDVRITAAGLALIGAGIALLLLHTSRDALVGAGLGVAGFGLGLSAVATTSMATDVPRRLRAITSGTANTSAQLGTAIGTAALMLLAAMTTGVPARTTGPPSIAWATAAACAVAAAIVFGVMRPSGSRVGSAEPGAHR